ncbi:MAG TPA: hypothetical protein VNP98_07380 [Chthoniobacterales bacterium]|nr:hypothetical protein [Chthoniobacterales bacterium]
MENELPNPGRIPKEDDLVALCRALNEQAARYLIVGGFAIIHHGYLRATEDIDLLLDGDMENQTRVKRALETLPDRVILELGDDDIRDYTVVRVSDEILVDLMITACGIDYAEASKSIELAEIHGVSIPFADVHLLLRMKQTHREKDAEDRVFLQRKISEMSQTNE